MFLQEFEDAIRRNRMNVQNWIKYAQWEESQKEIQRFIYKDNYELKIAFFLCLDVGLCGREL